MHHRSARALALAALVAAPLPALAQNADQEIRRGLELRRQGRDDEALEVFRRVWETSPSPRARAQMGFAEQALGRWSEADLHVREAAVSGSDPWVSRNRAALDASLAVIDQHMGRLDVRGGPAGATVLVEGRAVGTLPLTEPLRLVAGNVTLTLRADGYAETSRSVSIPARGLARETIELSASRPAVEPAPAPAQAPAAVAPSAPAPSAPAPSTPPPAVVDPRVEQPASSSTQQTVGWIMVGTGGAAILGGLVAQVIREGRISEFNANPMCREFQGNVFGGASCTNLHAGADTAQTAAIVSFAAGGALAAVGAILVLTAPSRNSPRSAWSCEPTLGGASCRFRF